ncbi:hypothetical protein PV08_04314 [Exophiala spinifera]|uniref:Uncharacterized protein n=1 Tax=Exophiala spinifera TaxID=91928 RepID=A0A0D2BDU5_9EURO|nr:uncharacterized protein PV08_04314 [Exophiala spinifera]KIW17123.1 hypothetical protein PV08_04314 [Exophiala spinifera]
MDQSVQPDHDNGPVAEEWDQWLNSPLFISDSDLLPSQQDVVEEDPAEMQPTNANVGGLVNTSDNKEALNSGTASTQLGSLEVGFGFDDTFTLDVWFGVNNEDSCSINTFGGNTVTSGDTLSHPLVQDISEINESFTIPQEPLSQEVRGSENSAGCDLHSNQKLLGGSQLSTEPQQLTLTDSASSEPQPRGQQRANRSNTQAQNPTKFVPKAAPRKPTETDKLLGLSYQRYSLDQPKTPRRRDHKNILSLRNSRGQCIRCIYRHRKNTGAISDFLKSKTPGQKRRSVAFDVYSCFENSFWGFEEPTLETWNLLQAITNLAASDETSNLSIFWRRCLTESGFQAPATFAMSSLLLAKPDYLRLLAPEQESFVRACRSHSSSCLLKIIDRVVRGQSFPNCGSSGRESLSESTVIFAMLLLGSMIHLSIHENALDRKAHDAYQFLERYLTETLRLIGPSLENSGYHNPGSSDWFVLQKINTRLTHCHFLPDESDLNSYQAFARFSGLRDLGSPNDYMALVPLSWWKSRNYPSLPGLTAGDLYNTLGLVCCCISDNTTRPSELLQKARRSWAGIRLFVGLLTDDIVAQIAPCRSLPHDSFFSDLISEWKFVLEFFEEIRPKHFKHFDLINYVGTWGDFLQGAYVCSLPVVLMSMRVISLDRLVTTLCVLSLYEKYRLAAIFLLRHPAGMDLVAKLLSIRHRVEEGALSGTVTGDK